MERHTEQDIERHTEYAPAKINLFLKVKPQMLDGKHLLESIFTTISLYDSLTFDFEGKGPLAIDAVSLETSAPAHMAFELAADKNIVMRAVSLFISTFGGKMIDAKRLHIRLEKRIPVQAGLGGGSTDAAAALKVLARAANIDKTTPELLRIACLLGADVPFFLYGGCAFMGRFGDKLIESLPCPTLDLALVKPAEGISTAKVYRAFDEQKPGGSGGVKTAAADSAPPAAAADSSPLIAALRNGAPAHELSKLMANNLEPVATSMLNDITIIKRHLDAMPGVVKTMLAGSGPTVFAVCEDAGTAQRVAESLAKLGYWSCAVKTRIS